MRFKESVLVLIWSMSMLAQKSQGTNQVQEPKVARREFLSHSIARIAKFHCILLINSKGIRQPSQLDARSKLYPYITPRPTNILFRKKQCFSHIARCQWNVDRALWIYSSWSYFHPYFAFFFFFPDPWSHDRWWSAKEEEERERSNSKIFLFLGKNIKLWGGRIS